MSGDDAVGDRLVFARTPAGLPVAECELAPGETGMLADLAAQATARGAVVLWVHSTTDLSTAGFARRQGYRRFIAPALPPCDQLPLLDTVTAIGLLSRAFAGQWGHHQPDQATPAILAQTRFARLPGRPQLT